ncbi:hypothetical protein PROFUN_14972 [Planoprotostelium fungivorum]|uniref:Uncharacterized protein n=1 Tax=Planoprotostelium fungivorum TaxID=1890364 RepID=A0A2P6MYB6_9EUKA|nr:hypothetical protein PROFUN_14972 [Planoprotostelium fungivorum]
MAKHQKDQNSSKMLVFKDKPIQSSTSLYLAQSLLDLYFQLMILNVS